VSTRVAQARTAALGRRGTRGLEARVCGRLGGTSPLMADAIRNAQGLPIVGMVGRV